MTRVARGLAYAVAAEAALLAVAGVWAWNRERIAARWHRKAEP